LKGLGMAGGRTLEVGSTKIRLPSMGVRKERAA